jgi:NADP-dependent 3-hydroxy acid dehydrogenase YdfG
MNSVIVEKHKKKKQKKKKKKTMRNFNGLKSKKIAKWVYVSTKVPKIVPTLRRLF